MKQSRSLDPNCVFRRGWNQRVRRLSQFSQRFTCRLKHEQYNRCLDLAANNIILNIMKTLSKNRSGEIISTHQMRFQFDRVLRAVKAGRALTLTYRNRPLARIVPLQTELEIPEDDPIFRLHELAEPIGPLTNAQIDAAIYGK